MFAPSWSAARSASATRSTRSAALGAAPDPSQDRRRRASTTARTRRSPGSNAPQRPLLFAKFPSSVIGPERADRRSTPRSPSASTGRSSSRSSSAGGCEMSQPQRRLDHVLRLHGRQRRLRPRRPVQRWPVDPREEPRHFLPAWAGGRHAVTSSGTTADLRLTTKVNGEVDAGRHDRQHDFRHLRDLWSSARAASPSMPGDVILTGTPDGCGEFMDPPRASEARRRRRSRGRGHRQDREPVVVQSARAT